MKESGDHFSALPSGVARPEREREVNGISNLAGHTSENKTRSFLCLFFFFFLSCSYAN